MEDAIGTPDLTLNIRKETLIEAPPEMVWESVLEQMGPHAEWPNGQDMKMKFEAWPGGRWWRDLGNNSGHLWAHVQVIKPHALLELTGPMMMSYPVINHVSYRLTPEGANTKLIFAHRGFGEITLEHRQGLDKGWGMLLETIRKKSMR